jgi:hypothetical protein
VKPLLQRLVYHFSAGQPKVFSNLIEALNHVGRQFDFKTVQPRMFVTNPLTAFIKPALLSTVIRIAARAPGPRRGKHIYRGTIFGLDRHPPLRLI